MMDMGAGAGPDAGVHRMEGELPSSYIASVFVR